MPVRCDSLSSEPRPVRSIATWNLNLSFEIGAVVMVNHGRAPAMLMELEERVSETAGLLASPVDGR
jgi:hypothetical protein